jgi:hypothetical protein
VAGGIGSGSVGQQGDGDQGVRAECRSRNSADSVVQIGGSVRAQNRRGRRLLVDDPHWV